MICAKHSIPINVRGGGGGGLITLPLFVVYKISYYNCINLYGAVYLEGDMLLFLCVIIV